jgi:hypothetical protein
MDRGSIALEIWYLYSRVYEGGDGCLDRLIGAGAYTRWLDAEMRDDYLDQVSLFELEMIRAELENAVGECCF